MNNQKQPKTMITKAITISLIITAIHQSMKDGMIFEKLRTAAANLLDKARVPILKKPLYECLICMGGIWTPALYGLDWEIIPTMLATIGLNTLIAYLTEREP